MEQSSQSNIRNMKIAITGATGRLGRLLVHYFLEKGCAVRAIVRSPQTAARIFNDRTNLEIRHANLSLPKTLNNITDGCDIVLFAAGARRPCYALDTEAAEDFEKINVEGPRLLGESILCSGKIPLIHLGSLFALGIESTGKLTENSEAHPVTPFEHSELKGERALLSLNKYEGLDCRILRLPPITGVTARGGLLDCIRTASRDYDWKNEFSQFANCTKPFLTVPDFLSLIDAAIITGTSGQIYQVSSGNFTSMDLLNLFQKDAVPNSDFSVFMKSHPDRFKMLTKLVRQYLRWNVTVLNKHSTETLNWYPKYDESYTLKNWTQSCNY